MANETVNVQAPVTAPAATPAAPETAAPATAAATPEAPKPEAAKVAAEIRRLKLKMDGQELDLPEEEVIKLAQMSGSAQKRWENAAALRKQVEQVAEMLAKDPATALKKIMDPAAYRALLENELTEIVKRDAESPEAKKIREQEERLRAYEMKEKADGEAAEKQKQEAAKSAKDKADAERTAQYMKQYEELFTKALDESGLPKNAYTVKRMAELQKVNVKKGFNLDAANLAKLVRQDYEAEHRQMLGGMDGEKLLAWLGDELTGKMTKAQIKKLRSANAQKFSTPAPETQQETTAPQGSWREFSKRKRLLG